MNNKLNNLIEEYNNKIAQLQVEQLTNFMTGKYQEMFRNLENIKQLLGVVEDLKKVA